MGVREPLLQVLGESSSSEVAAKRPGKDSLSSPCQTQQLLNLMFLEIAGSSSVPSHQLGFV